MARLNVIDRIGALYRISLYRNTVYLILRSVVTAAFGFLFWIIAARLYPAEIVGLASAAISAIYLVSRLSSVGLSFGLMKSLQTANSNSSLIINTVFVACGIFSVAFSVVFLAGLGLWAPALIFLQQNLFYFLAFILFTVGDNLSGALDSVFIAERKSEFCFIRSIIFNVAKVGMLVALFQHFAVFGIFASQGTGPVIAVLIGIIFFLPKVFNGYSFSPILNSAVLNDMIHFSFANYVIEFLWAAPGLVLPIMVLNLLGAEQNAYFYIGWTMSSFLGAIGTSASLSLFAEGSYAKTELYRHSKQSLKSVLIILVPAIILLMVLAANLLMLFGKSYSESALYLLWSLIPASLPLSINWLYIGKKRAQHDMKMVIIFSILIASFTLAISYVLMPFLGVLGVGIAWTSCQLVGSLFVIRTLLYK